MDEQSIFLRALDQPAGAQRAAWLDEMCGIDSPLRERMDALLRRHELASSFLETPAAEFNETVVPTSSDDNWVASLQATPESRHGPAVVLGHVGHSMLGALRHTINIPQVILRELAAEKAEPIQRPNSPEMPQPAASSRYQLQGEIARGGMGAIIKGRDTDLGRELAIKVLLDQHKDNPLVIRRFIEEAQIGGQLQHPGIAPVYELGQFADNRPYFSMKLVKGETLAKLLADRSGPQADRGRLMVIFEQVCQTMAYAHSRGVIHRDLKPSNVMVGAFGEVQVMDWGLAKVLLTGGVSDEKNSPGQHRSPSNTQTVRNQVERETPSALGTLESQTQMGSIMGTPAYMPPEQALGDIDHLDERADVFGLGAILCEILTGKPPYVAEDGTQLFRMANQGDLADCFARLDACGAEPELIALTKQCLDFTPAQRPRDASVLAAEVSRFLESVQAKLYETEMARVATEARAEESARRHKLIHFAGTAVTLSLIIGLAASGWQMMRANREATKAEVESRLARKAEQAANELVKAEAAARALAQQETRRAEAATERAQEQLTRSESLIYASKIMLAQTDFESGNGTLTQHYLDECQVNLRGWEHRYLSTRIRAKQTLVGHRGSVTGVAVSFDGKWIITGSSDRSARVWDADTGQQLLTLEGHTDNVTCVAISSDGRRIVTGSNDGTAKIWDASSGQEILTRANHPDEVRTVAFSPDGNRVAVGGGTSYRPSDVTVWDAHTGQQLLVIKGHQDRVLSLAFSPDGKRLVTGCGQLARVWDDSGKELMSFRHEGALGIVWSVAISPDGKHVATGSEDGLARVWSTETGVEHCVLKGHAGWIADLEFSPDGRQIATASWDNTVKLWDAESGTELLTFKGHTGFVLGVAFSPDGRRIVSCCSDNTVKVWDAARGQKVVAFKPGPIGAVHGIAYSPDSRRVAIGCETGLVIVWDSETGQELLTLKGHEFKVTSLAFSPDGQRLVAGTEHDSVRIWNTTTGEQLRVLKGYTSPVAFHPDGTQIATGHDDHTLRLLDSESGEERFVLDGHTSIVRCAAFSSDGSRIATGSDDHTAKIWSTMTGDQLCALQGHHHIITGVVFSPDGRRVVTSSQDKTATVWDAENGQPLLELTGHTSAVSGVAFSPDGQRIVTASYDRSVKLWEAHTGLEVLSLHGHKVEVLCVAVSADGQSIVSGTANPDNTARVWRAEHSLSNNVWPLPDPSEQIHFHTEQAEMAELQNRTFAAEVHRRLAARAESELPAMQRMQSLLSNEAQPENDAERQSLVVLLSRRAAKYIATEQWEPAFVDMKRIVEIQPNQVPNAFDSFRALERWNEAAHFGHELLQQDPAESLHWILVAPVMAQSSNEADYIAFCEWIVNQPAETALLADRSIKACLLKPGVADLAKLPANVLAQALDEGTAPDWFPSYGWACRALLAYRCGDSELAVKYADRSEAHSPSDVIRAMNQATLTMAHHELKNLDAARRALAEASRIISHCRDLPGSNLHPDLMIAQILFREAEIKVKEADASSPAER